uniref:Dicer-2 n=1 Tax=Strigamia maritima TaxID=126957 RepID=T1J619_STRMM
MATSRDQSEELLPREYQVELLEKAIKKNIVVCLGTGSGKTFIAVMLIREMMESIKKPFKNGGKRTFFLAKTVPLVAQQATVIRQHTGLQVGHYTGADNVDAWDLDVWKREFEKNEVLVMTTQILVNILNMAFIQLSQINLLIFDECHHAVGGDPIVQVMKNFARCSLKEQPKVMGLTASVLNGKCKPNQIIGKIKSLEIRMHCVIETPTDTLVAAHFSTKPKELFICCSDLSVYDSLKNGLVTALKSQLDLLPKIPSEKDLEKFAVNIDDDEEDEEDFDDDFDDEDEFKHIIGPVIKLSRLLKDLMFAVQELGLWCTNIIAKQMVVELAKIEDDVTEENMEHFRSVKPFIENMVAGFEKYFEKFDKYTKCELMMRFSSHKVRRLFETLLKYKPTNVQPNEELIRQKQLLMNVSSNDKAAMKEFDERCPKSDDFKAIIFVERRSTAWVINRFIHQLKEHNEDYHFITSEFVMGHGADPAKLNYAQMKSRKQAEKILKFRLKECNVLVATRVVEEGMDIPTCNLVIRFDEPKDFRAYVQSKGRARAVDSNYIMLVKEDDYENLSGNIALYRNIEDALQEICKERMPPTEREIANFYDMDIPPYYTRGLEGPVVTMFSCIQLVNRYCALLPKDKFTRLSPRIKFQKILPKCPPPLGDVDADDPDLWDDFDVLLSNAVQGEKYEFRCILWLPVNSSVRKGIKGDIMGSLKLAKKSVAMTACILLHKCGELTNDLNPSCRDHSEFTRQLVTVEEEEVSPGSPLPGSLKRRQLYRKQVAPQFKVCPRPNVPCYMYLFRIKLSEWTKDKIGGTMYDSEKCCHNFGIITSCALPEVNPFPIFTRHGKHWVEIVEVEKDLKFENLELEQLARFHRNFFIQFLRINSIPMDFNPLGADMSFFVIPIINYGAASEPLYFPDWELIEDVNKHEFGDLPSERERAKFQFEEGKFADSVVTPLYLTERLFYVVKRTMNGINPSYPFPNEQFKTFTQYYKKSDVAIQSMTQPLIAVRLITDVGLNMLPIKVEKTAKKKSMVLNGEVVDRETFLVPEVCSVLPIRASHFNQGTMIPSILYRLNDLFLAHEFLKEVSADSHCINVSDMIHSAWSNVEKKCRDAAVKNENNWEFDYKIENGIQFSTAEADPAPHVILNALTTRAANDCFDLERLEFLGDSFLKYVTTLYLFSEFPNADEGRLTSGRGTLVSNSHLYRLAKSVGLSELVKTEIFSPASHWLPPGFTMKRESEYRLIEAGMPFHAWKYFIGYDLTKMDNGQIWNLAILTHNKEKTKSVGKSADDIVHLVKDENVMNLAKYQLIADKSVADGVEAILGAYLLYSGPKAALRFLVYLGFKIFPVDESTGMSEIRPYNFPTTALINPQKAIPAKLLAGLDAFEEGIGYVFRDKSFLVQAFTHPSYYNNQVTDCYQRLEFLGDAILDYLITWHLFEDKRKFTPGKLTDMRSALVNNVTFAKLAIQSHFNYHLNARSPSLFNAITKFLALAERDKLNVKVSFKLVSKLFECALSFLIRFQLLFEENECSDEEEVEVPKALGDIFESVAGAIYLDSGCSLDAVWKVYFKMMEQIISAFIKVGLISKNIYNFCRYCRRVYDKYTQGPSSRSLRVVSRHTVQAKPVVKKEEDEPQKYIVTVRLAAKTFRGVGPNARQAKINVAKVILRFVKKSPKNMKIMGGVDPNLANSAEEQKPLTLDDIFEMDEIEVEEEDEVEAMDVV